MKETIEFLEEIDRRLALLARSIYHNIDDETTKTQMIFLFGQLHERTDYIQDIIRSRVLKLKKEASNG